MTAVTKFVAARRHCISGMSHVAKRGQFGLETCERLALAAAHKHDRERPSEQVFYLAGLIRYDRLTRV